MSYISLLLLPRREWKGSGQGCLLLLPGNEGIRLGSMGFLMNCWPINGIRSCIAQYTKDGRTPSWFRNAPHYFCYWEGSRPARRIGNWYQNKILRWRGKGFIVSSSVFMFWNDFTPYNQSHLLKPNGSIKHPSRIMRKSVMNSSGTWM